MADVLNLAAESDRNIIGDDSTPTLTLENTSSGNCLKLQNAGGTGIPLSIVSAPTTALYIPDGGGITLDGGVDMSSNATETAALTLDHGSVIGSPTVAPLTILTSAASGAIMNIDSPLISTASLSVMAGAFPVRMVGEDKIVYIPGYVVA